MKKNLLMIGALVSTLTLSSCLDDDNPYENAWLGTATLKPTGEKTYILQLDDSTTLHPIDGYIPYFGINQERRVRFAFTLADSKENLKDAKYKYDVNINFMDSILTKNIAPNLFEENDNFYGNDPVDMRNIWIEDNYITFYFWTSFGGYKSHYLNLVQMDPEKPYEFEFRHNAYNDPKLATGRGLVSFRLHNLPNTNGETVKLKIKYNSYRGPLEVTFDYNSQKPEAGKAPQLDTYDFQNIK